MDITVKIVEPMELAAVKSEGGPPTFGKTWHSLHAALAAQGHRGQRFLGVFSVAALDGSSFRWYAAATDVGPLATTPIAAPLEALALDGGKYATWIYTGPYDGLGAAWGAFVSGVAAQELELDLARPCFERYLDDPATTNPIALRTELAVPVKVGSTTAVGTTSP